MNNALIETRHLTVHRSGQTVLSDINLHIAQGEFVAIIGQSGAGKSTLLHTLARHLPYSGEIIIPQNIGMIFQERAVFPWLTVQQNIAFGLTLDKTAKAELIHECLHLAGLENKAHIYPAELSGGQVQRIAIARAIAHKPDVLLMDEPFGSLDIHTRKQMHTWLLDIWRTYKPTIILVTHDIEEALMLADKILVLDDGKIRSEFNELPSSQNGYSLEFLQMRKEIGESLIQ